MADIVIPQNYSSILGAYGPSIAVGQSFIATSNTLSSVTFTVDIVNNSYFNMMEGVSYRAVVVDMLTKKVIYTSAQKYIALLPGESYNSNPFYYYHGASQSELRDTTASLSDLAVTPGASYAVFLQFSSDGESLAYAASSNNAYTGGSLVVTSSSNLNNAIYPVSMSLNPYWDLKLTVKGGVSNTAPVAVADAALAVEDGSAVTINVLANDTDANTGDTKTLVSVNTVGTTGAVSINANGSLTYNPGSGFQSLGVGQSATDTFRYTMKDSAGLQSSATVSVSVAGRNDAVVAVADTASAMEDGAAINIAVLANDTDVDSGDTKAIASVDTIGTIGTVTVNQDGTVSYATGTAFQSLGAGATTTDTFGYTVQDRAGASSSATATVTVTGTNDAPLAANDGATVSEDQSVTIHVLANDTDIDVGDTKSIVSVSASQEGASVSIVDGTIVYVADADAQDALVDGSTSIDTLTYVMSDRDGVQSTATVTVTVVGVPNGADVIGTNKSDAALNGTALDEKLDGGNGDDVMNGLGGADALFGGNGSDKLSGGAGRDMLWGGNGTDILDGGAGNDVLEGGEGKDTFVFLGAFGKDVVTDFKPQNDTIKIDSALAANFASIMSVAVEQSGMVIINLDATHSIALVGVSLADLSAKDFIFA